MSTSANAPGEPGRDRGDDAVDPDSGQPDGTGDAAGGRPEGPQRPQGTPDTGSDAQARPGQDVTKQVRQEARKSEAAARRTARGGSDRPARKPAKAATKGSAVPGREGQGLGFFARIALFVRQVIAEIRKVVTPTRNELVTFSVVVIVFILAMMVYVGVLDFGIGRLVLWMFGN